MSRPVTVTVGPLAAADDDAVSTTQKAAGAQYLVINGAKSDGTTANNVCLSQSPTTTFTLNGSLVSGGVAYLGYMRRIYFTCAGNESTKTVVIVGQGYGPNGGPYAITETLTLANASIVASQKLYYSITSITISTASAGAITVGAAGVATLDMARRIIATSGGNDTGITITLTGTDWANTPISETFTGASGGAASSVQSFKTVTSVLTSGAVATTIIIGTNTVADSPWMLFDAYAALSQVAIQCTVSGTCNYSVYQTLDNPTSIGNPAIYNRPDLVTWVAHPDTAVVGATATAQANYAYAPAFTKVVLNSGSGTVTMTDIQAGLFR